MLKQFLSNFPEDSFYSSDIKYLEKIIQGIEKASQSTVHIIGLARECEQALTYNILRIERLRKYFKDSSVFILENDSQDRTKSILTKYAKERNVSISLNTFDKVRHPQNKSTQRMIDMVFYRNLTLESIPKCDYVVIYDMDIDGGFSYEGVMSSIGYNLDCVGSNSLLINNGYIYYDTFALRYNNLTDKQKHEIVLTNRELPFQVESCFGGLGLYKYETLQNVKYDSYDCEHVCLHNEIRKNGYSVWMNPAQIVLYDKTRYCVI